MHASADAVCSCLLTVLGVAAAACTQLRAGWQWPGRRVMLNLGQDAVAGKGGARRLNTPAAASSSACPPLGGGVR